MINGRNKVTIQKDGDSATVLINNPPVNVIDIEVLQDLITSLSGIETEDKIEKVIIKSALAGIFSAGFDTSCILIRMEDRMDNIFTLARTVSWLVRSSEKLYIAEVSGLCLGLGYELALACDIVSCGDRVKVGFPDIKFGMPFLTGIPWKLFPESALHQMLSGKVSGVNSLNIPGLMPQGEAENMSRNFLSALRFYKRTKPRETNQLDGLISKVYDLGSIDLKGLERFRELIISGLEPPLNPDGNIDSEKV